MNQQTPYEITIADKLGQLQVPDLREAIWKRIEDQLDLDQPTDDQPGGPNSPKPLDWISITKRFGSFALVVAVISIIFIINKKTPGKHIGPGKTPASIEQSLPYVDSTAAPPGDSRQPANLPVAQPPGEQPPSIIPGNVDDNVFTEPGIPVNDRQVSSDTVPQQITAPPPPIKNADPPRQDSTQRKPRGFKGMKDDDYKISLKKDSAGN